MTHGTSYNFALLNKSIIRALREIWNKSFFENPIAIRLAGLERGLKGILQAKISELRDLKLQS